MPPDAASPAASRPETIRRQGWVRRVSVWRLTRRGWVVVVSVLALVTALFLWGIYPFLALNAPVPSEVLVLEGWVADYVVKAAVMEFRQGDYDRVYVTGGPIDRGAHLSEYKNYAALGAAVISYFGAPTNQIQPVPAPKVRRDRTYTSALALREWMEAHEALPKSMNVVTAGPHARRTQLLFQKAFGKRCAIGVISIPDEEYDPRRWWAYSEGVRTLMGESVAYAYARLFFRVSADRGVENKAGEDSTETSP